MGLRLICLLIGLHLVLLGVSFAGWQGPQVLVEGVGGEGDGEFGLGSFGTGDTYPDIAAILPDGKILIDDYVHNRLQLFDENGQRVKVIVPVLIEKNENVERYKYEEYGVRKAYRYTNKGTSIARKRRAFYEYDENGVKIKEYEESSFVGGIVKNIRQGDGSYTSDVEYEDKTYRVPSRSSRYTRDVNDYLYTSFRRRSHDHISNDRSFFYAVYKYDICGRLVSEFVMPTTEYEPYVIPEGPVAPPRTIRNEYGPPVIGPDGSIYAYKRTPDTYSILKWEWVDDPSDPVPGPDAPSELAVTPSTTSLYLTWKASPQDPGCVDSYQIERAGSVDGSYSSIATVEVGKLNYNDADASAGSTYFYKVRASAGGGYSDYTETVSGTRPQ